MSCPFFETAQVNSKSEEEERTPRGFSIYSLIKFYANLSRYKYVTKLYRRTTR